MKTRNIKKEIEKTIKPFLEKLQEQSYIKGIVLLGGLGKRNFIDKYSDIDLTVFISKKDAKKISLPFEFHYQSNGKTLEFNIHQQILEEEERIKKWKDFKIEAYARGKIIYDPTKRVSKLIKNKIRFDENEAFDRLIWIMQQYKWRGQIHSIRAYRRGYPEASHGLLNQCAEILLEAIYLLNKRYLPHKKWELVYLNEMKKPFNRLNSEFKKVMIIKNYHLSDIKRRIKILDKIYGLVLNEILKQYKNSPRDPYKYYYKNFVQLNKFTKIDRILQNFKEKSHNKKEIKQLEGFLCFNLIDTKDKFLKKLHRNNNMRNILKSKFYIEKYKDVIK
ncbi:hypothetical protein AMJ49_04650 [Parcubacteria bacterium DG_74_2]|nr:MAG: hypothetical protein AMJ49_04650 [Parcubacteria bacterium DG_74_2]